MTYTIPDTELKINNSNKRYSIIDCFIHFRSRNAIVNELESKRNQWATELQNADKKVAVLRDKMTVRTVYVPTKVIITSRGEHADAAGSQ